MTDLAGFEQAFRSAGLPSFIAERTAREDIWTRAFPLLSLVFGAEILGAVDLKLSFWANLALILAAVGVLVATLAVLNAVRHRPLLAGPRGVGNPELVAFVLVPALLPLVLNQQPVSALVTALANLSLLALLYGVIGFGVLSIVGWAGRRLVSQLATAANLVARAIPLLLLFSVVLFINTEMWQTFALLRTWRVLGLVGLLATLGTVFLVVRLPREVAQLEADVLADAPALDHRERVNVALVMLVSQSLQVVVVAVGVGAFFVALGLLTLSPSLIETWTGSAVHEVFGRDGVVVTSELLRVATAIAGFSGFYYAIAVLTDATYREEFAAEITEQMRESFRLRVSYRQALGELPAELG